MNANLTKTPMRARVVHAVARMLGILVHIEGSPFGKSMGAHQQNHTDQQSGR